jgi:hypothetical protein
MFYLQLIQILSGFFNHSLGLINSPRIRSATITITIFTITIFKNEWFKKKV